LIAKGPNSRTASSPAILLFLAYVLIRFAMIDYFGDEDREKNNIYILHSIKNRRRRSHTPSL
jgi:hypothetical protein